MKSFKNKMPLYFLISLSIIILSKSEYLTPIGICTKGRIGIYNDWRSGGKCGYGEHQEAIISTSMFPAAPNQDFFNSPAQCGVCYEMVGPNGAIRVRVEDYCPKSESYCSGDTTHFKVADEGTSYIMGSANSANITFRMVACDIYENIKIIIDKDLDINSYYFSFIVLNHRLAVSRIEMNQNYSNIWSNLDRQENNHWIYYNTQERIKFPLQLRIYSINGDYVRAFINNLEANKDYFADGNFQVPENTYFDPVTLQKLNINADNITKCCKNTDTTFNYIYINGVVNSEYVNSTQNVSVIYNSSDSYRGRHSIHATFSSYGKLFFRSITPINAEQFTTITITMKANKTCDNCLYIRAYDLNNHLIISFNEANTWKDYSFSFDKLGVVNNQFNGIIFEYNQNSNETFDIYIDKIELILDIDISSSGLCFSTTGNNSYTPSDGQDEEEEEDYDNPYYIYINSIRVYEESPKILNFRTKEFLNYDNKKVVITLNRNNNTYNISNCTFQNPYVISSFSCVFPDNIPDGVYNINPEFNDWNFSYSKDIEIKNGLIICGNINSLKQKYSNVYYSSLILIYSKEKVITPGERINFPVYPIPQEEYNLENDEIILLNKEKDKSLNLKYCRQKINNKYVVSVQCTVSNNVIIGNYTSLYSDQIVSLANGQTINLMVKNNNGGIVRSGNNRQINTNLTIAEKHNFSLIFNILYYGSNLREGAEFPHKVYLYGTKKDSNKRQLNEVYDTQVVFQNCITKLYSGDYSAIGSLECPAPDFIPAGTYTKLESDGIDSNVQAPVNLYFDRDFNKSSTSNMGENKNYENDNSTDFDGSISNKEDDSSSGSSKDWIVWLIVGILAVVLIAMILIIIAFKKGDNEDDSNDVQNVNNTSNTQNNNTSS